MSICNKERMKRITKLHRYINISRYSIVTRFMCPMECYKRIYEQYFVVVRISITDDNFVFAFKLRSGKHKDLRRTRTARLNVSRRVKDVKSVLLSKKSKILLDETLGAFVFGSVGLRLINDFAEFGWSHIVQNLDVDKITKNLLYQREGV